MSVKQRRMSDKSLANLKPFKPGQSGNPKGRPPGMRLSNLYRAELEKTGPDGRTMGEVIAEKIVTMACNGDLGAMREIVDRLEGKPRQAVDLEASITDWREAARAYGLDESAVIEEARALIEHGQSDID